MYKHVRDQIGGQLYQFCVRCLEGAARLTPVRRQAIAEEFAEGAKMENDSVSAATNFLHKWRKSKQLLHRCDLVPPTWEEVEQDCMRFLPTDTCMKIYKEFSIREQREFYHFMTFRVSKTVAHYMYQLPPCYIPTTIGQAIVVIQRWVDSHTMTQKVTTAKSINALHDGTAFTGEYTSESGKDVNKDGGSISAITNNHSANLQVQDPHRW